MPKMIIIECSDEEADRMVEQLKNMIAEYEYHPYHGPGKVYEFGSLRIDQPKQEVTINGVMVDLTRREFEILGLLAEHQNQALSWFERRNLYGTKNSYRNPGKPSAG